MSKRPPTRQTEDVGDFLAGLIWIVVCIVMVLVLLTQWDWFDWFSVW